MWMTGVLTQVGQQYLNLFPSSEIGRLKRIVHLIYKLCLKAVFVCIRFNGANVFFFFSSEQTFVFNKKHFFNKKKRARSQNWCLTIPKLVPDGPRNGAWRSSGTISGIVSEIPNMRPDDWLYRRVQTVPDNRQAPILKSSGTSFGISRLLFGYKKEPKRCFRVFKGVFELPYVNICYISSHSNHVNHPLGPKQGLWNSLWIFTGLNR